MMAGGNGTQQSIRKAIGALKDSTKVGLAKVNSEYKDLDVAVVKATNHDEQIAKEKHIRTIFDAVSASRPRADVSYCVSSLARRLAKTRNWAVALKILIVLHRSMREVDLTFQGELIEFTRSKGHILNLSHFKDDSSPQAWDYSAWVRTYALYLEEKLECFRILKYDVQREQCKLKDVDTVQLLEQLPALQQLLYRLVACQPEGAAVYNNVIKYALSFVASESVKVYAAIDDGILNLVNKFFDMQRHDAVRALEIYRKAGNQAERLSEFYEICKGFDLGLSEKFMMIKQPPELFVTAMEEYVKEAPMSLLLPRNSIDDETDESPKAILAIEYKQVNDDNGRSETSAAASVLPEKATCDELADSPVADLLGLDDFNQDSAALDVKNASAFDILLDENPSCSTSNIDLAGETATWELTLVTNSSSTQHFTGERKLAGGLDTLTLDSLYDDAIARMSNQNGGSHVGQVATNPFAIAQTDDPFHASNGVAPPTNVQMAAMAQQQALMRQQQQMLGKDPTNPFGDPYGGLGLPPCQSQSPYAGYI